MMTLSTTVLENSRQILIARQEDPASHKVLIRIDAEPSWVADCPSREACYEASQRVMTAVWGRDRVRGGVNATNSMVWEMTNLIERLAGC
jgi:hypothetical protein